jgi:hypothetical protein
MSATSTRQEQRSVFGNRSIEQAAKNTAARTASVRSVASEPTASTGVGLRPEPHANEGACSP